MMATFENRFDLSDLLTNYGRVAYVDLNFRAMGGLHKLPVRFVDCTLHNESLT